VVGVCAQGGCLGQMLLSVCCKLVLDLGTGVM
jgi:hypothetical protein